MLNNLYLRMAANKLFNLFLLLLFSAKAFSITYYVSSTGSDDNAGTSIATAWKTINKVNSSKFYPGDALYFEGGQTFEGSLSLDGSNYLNSDDAGPGNVFVISSYGEGRATINAGTSYGFSAHNVQGLSISNLIFDGNSMLTNTNSGLILLADVSGDKKFSNISIENIEVKNFGAHGVKIGGWNGLTGYKNLTLDQVSVHDVLANGIQVYGFVPQPANNVWPNENVSILNCEVYNVPGFNDPASHEGNGIEVSGVDGGLIEHCVAHDNGQNNTHCGGPGGIWFWDSNNCTIQYCESYRNHSGSGNCDGMGFDLDGGMTNSVMQYNYSHDNDGAGYLLGQFENARPWANNTVRYNISENDGVLNEGSIGLFKGPGTTMSGAYIYNNTIYVSPQTANSGACAVYFKNWETGIDNVAFYNNIFFSAGGVPFINIPAGYSAFFAGNIYWAAGGNFSIKYQGSSYSSLDAWRTATTPNEEVAGGKNTGSMNDPLLTNAGAGGTVGFGHDLSSLNAYKINSISSPAYNAALDLSSLYTINAGTRDFWGTILPGGSADDIGANQHSATLPVVLSDFRGSCSSGLTQNISWSTGEETNMKSFELMYSADGISFSRLAEISPKGSNSRYSYINNLGSPANSYYQLKMTDLDGSVSYSPVVNVNCGKTVNRIRVWPNPFTWSVNISMISATGGPVSLALYDAVGKLLSLKYLQLQKGSNRLSWNGMDNLPAGIYLLQVVSRVKTAHFELVKAAE